MSGSPAPGLTLAALALLVAGAWWYFASRAKRAAEIATPFPDEWREWLMASCPVYRRMPEALRRRLEPAVRAFLRDIRFVGCNGLTVTDEMRVLIATQACMLIVARHPGAYRDLMSVLVYPEEFVVNRQAEDEAGVVTEFEDVLSGESHDTSRIVLSWRDVIEPPAEEEICNVVLHEFAHYLDSSVGGDFTDLDSRHESLQDWHEILEAEFNDHADAVENDEDTLINPDGAEHPSEFFAYATEVFFEAPEALKDRHPKLYEGLKETYGLDPASWNPESPRSPGG
jgi:Mlc titration factor MtfA (ptsG expression regulator)